MHLNPAFIILGKIHSTAAKMKAAFFQVYLCVTLLFCCATQSCNKDVSLNGHCPALYYSSMDQITGFYNRPFSLPSFSPIVANKLVYLIPTSGSANKVCMYDIASGQTTSFSTSLSCNNKISWGRNNKLLLFSYSMSQDTSYDGAPVAINPDGTGADTLPASQPLHGYWSADCNKIIYGSFYFISPYSPAGPGSLGIWSITGQLLDSISLYYVDDYDWSSSNQIAVVYNYKYLNIYDTTLHLVKTIRLIADDYPYDYAFSVAWVPNSTKVVWCDIKGIYETDITNSQTTLVKAAANNDVYNSVSISANGAYIVSFKLHWDGCGQPSSYTSYNSSGSIISPDMQSLVLVNVSTGAETTIYQ